MKKVLLLTPPYHAGVVEAAGRWPNIALVYIAGHLRRAGHLPVIYDAMTKGDDLEEIRRRIAAEKPDCVATTAYTASINAALDVLKAAKEIDPRIVTVIGGVHANFCHEELLKANPCLDFVVRGEGEETFPELLAALEAGGDLPRVRGIAFRRGLLSGSGKNTPEESGPPAVVATPPRPFIHDLDSLVPAWDLVEWDDYTMFVIPGSRLAVVNSTRGCNHDCSFCSQQKFWERTYRERSPENFVAELIHLNRTYGVDVAMLSDEYPTRNRRRWEKILDLIITSGLKVYLLLETRVEDILRDEAILPKYRQAGVLHIYVGVEATDQETLDRFNKRIKCEESARAIQLINAHGMISECSFVLGLPEETQESVQRTLALAKRYDPDFAHFLHIAPWPYADMYGELKDYVITGDYSKYNFVEPVVKPAGMSVEEIGQALIDCYREFYMDKVRHFHRILDPFKREYLLLSMQVMMRNSFLKKHLGGMGKIPEEVRRYLNEPAV
ncbi:MAG: cobalamin-dependent protein [Firmicutes bacterium]|nr:cobalamin-dependent protein [Bacillota bacterium]